MAPGTPRSFTSLGGSGVIINITDPTRISGAPCALIAIDINGIGTGGHGVRIVSTNLAGTSVVIENSKIDGFAGRGISDERTNGGKLVVSDTTVRHTANSGIRIAAGGVNRIDAALTNVRVHNSAVAALTFNGGAKAIGEQFGVLGKRHRSRHRAEQHQRKRGRQHDQREYDGHLHE